MSACPATHLAHQFDALQYHNNNNSAGMYMPRLRSISYLLSDAVIAAAAAAAHCLHICMYSAAGIAALIGTWPPGLA